MDVKTVPKQEFLVRNLSTQSVVLYPTRAHVVREIKDITLEPGTNEIEIYGLTPTADESSIKVDGTGSATISNMAVDLVFNRESFYEVYPEDNDSDIEMSDDYDSDNEEANGDKDIESLENYIERMEADHESLQEALKSVSRRLDVLDHYCNTLNAQHVDLCTLTTILESYREQREGLLKEYQTALADVRALEKEIEAEDKKLKRLANPIRYGKLKKEKAKAKEAARKNRIKLEKEKKRIRLKGERIKFWPKKVYRIVLRLETSSTMDTPTTSRRSSVSSITIGKQIHSATDHSDSGSNSVTLALSYVTTEASWSPRYDLHLSSLTRTGTIVYRAEFKNHTSEVWDKAQISLSTSQASFHGLGDEVPFMHAWHISLAKAGKGGGEYALTSPAEVSARNWAKTKARITSTNRNELFGLDTARGWSSSINSNGNKAVGGLFGSGNPNASVFGQSNSNTNTSNNYNTQAASNLREAPWALHYQGVNREPDNGNENTTASSAPRSAFAHEPGPQRMQRVQHDHDEIASQETALLQSQMSADHVDFEESTWEDHGFTTSYDIPGSRTLAPSSAPSQHKIVTLDFKDVILTSIAVPKLRAAAFMRARFRNPSTSITLLKGSAGLTLDGTFLGTTTLPRISPHELITLPLGVDPAIHISYAKPTVRRATQGTIFNKEGTQTFARSIWLSNTKTTSIELLVLDQIPVSEDEKLRIEITNPKGLTKEESSVSCGVAASNVASKGNGSKNSWGSARATLKKDGEVRFDVSLEKGAKCRLSLEYEARAPAGEHVVSKYT